MAVTTAYSFDRRTGEGFVNNDLTRDQSQVALTGLSGGGFFSAFYDNDGASISRILGETRNFSGVVVFEDNSLLNVTSTNAQFDPSVAQLANGNLVLLYTDLSGAESVVRLVIRNPNTHALVGSEILLPHIGGLPDYNADVTALADGGFVVVYTRDYGSGDNDIRAQIYNADGSLRGGNIVIDNSSSLNTEQPTVAALTGGGFVVAWVQAPAAGGDSAVYFEIYNATGVIQGAQSQAIAVFGTINTDIQVIGLQDGGFAVAWAENGWGNPNLDISLYAYNANGSYRGGAQANASALGGTQAGDQDRPTLTQLSNGMIVVAWRDAGGAVFQAFTPSASPVGVNNLEVSFVVEPEIAGTDDGRFAYVMTTNFGSTPNNIYQILYEMRRTSNSDAASDTINGDDLVDIMNGNDGNDTLNGLGANDTLSGGNGNDNLDGGAGDDVLIGGDGNDVITVDSALDAVLAGDGRDTIFASGINFTLLANMEDLGVVGTGLTGVGNAAANLLVSYGGGNFLLGAAGNDTLVGSGGNDELYGQADNDLLYGRVGADRLFGGDGDDTLVGEENGDFLAGENGVDTLFGQTGQDTLNGGEGDDFLYGGNENDALLGGGGGDRLYGESGEDDLFGGSGGDLLVGGDGFDRLFGNDDNDVLQGGNQGDQLFGEQGNDDLFGEDGEDVLSGGDGIDRLYGGLQGDRVVGGSGNDELYGEDGGDIIVGGAGGDLLVGGAGGDRFGFFDIAESNTAGGVDLIADFQIGLDLIDLSGVDAASTIGGDQAFNFVSSFTGAAGQATLTFFAGVNRTEFRGDVNGDGVADIVIIINGNVGAGDGFVL